MKYQVIVDDSYWQRFLPKEISEGDRELRVKEHMKQITDWLLREEGVIWSPSTCSLIDDELKHLVKIVPLFDHEGLRLIAAEREEQVQKHGFGPDRDDLLDGGQLESAAAALLTENPELWPEELDRGIFRHASEKDTLGRLTVAGALLAAELDRILRARSRGTAAPVTPTLPPAGTLVEVRPNVYDQALRIGYSQADAEQLSSLVGQVHQLRSSRFVNSTPPVIEVRLQNGTWLPFAACRVAHSLTEPSPSDDATA